MADALKLKDIATTTLIDVLQKSVKNLNHIMVKELRTNMAQQRTSPRPASRPTNNNNGSKNQVYAKAAMQMMRVRKYLTNGMANPITTKNTLTPEVIQKIITSAITSGNLGIIRLALCEWCNTLDCRGMKDDVRKNSLQTMEITSLPPNEFDWFSEDRFGMILTMGQACEIFSILGMSQCAPSVKELFINARRLDYWTCSSSIMELTADVLSQMRNLTTVVLRGMCDDYILKILGRSASAMKYLDVSGSNYVSDEGIRSLFFSDTNQNEANYLMKSYIMSNLRNMNLLARTLEVLDYSWTNATSLSRKMLFNFPGCFVFKRLFARNEQIAFGHHIFMRKKELFQAKIACENDPNYDEFKWTLNSLIRERGTTSFLKFSKQHPWKNCRLYLFSNNQSDVNQYNAIITPNEEEQRIYGIVNFQDSLITEIYSIFPININILGDVFQRLRTFRGHLTDTWKLNTGLLPELTVLDMFADPQTTVSILESAPNLERIKIRIMREPLINDHIMRSLTTFMCRRTLQELWIAPGSYRYSNEFKEEEEEPAPEMIVNFGAEKLPRFACDNDQESHADANCNIEESEVADLILLTSSTLRAIVMECPRLTRIGDIAWWMRVNEKDFKLICKELNDMDRNVIFTWENKLFASRA